MHGNIASLNKNACPRKIPESGLFVSAFQNHNMAIWQECYVTQESQVILYTHPDRAFSAAAKMDYRKRKVAYEDVDLSKQEDRIPELLNLTNGERVTPVIVENGTVTIGFKGGT